MLEIRGENGLSHIESVNHRRIINAHYREAFCPIDDGENDSLDGIAYYATSLDAMMMQTSFVKGGDLMNPASWEEVKLLEDTVFAVYIVSNNSSCSVMYIPNEAWIPAIMKAVLLSQAT